MDEPLVGQRQPKIFYYEADGLGSVTSLTDPTGATAATYTYDSFGFLTASTGSATNWFRYTARQFDSSTALYYYRARYYDPMTGRFLSEDPIGFDSGRNFYPYVLNNPIRFVDPSGSFPTWYHYQLTYDLARATFGGQARCQYDAFVVASANSNEDLTHSVREDIELITGFGLAWQRPGPHFPNDPVLRARTDSALSTCDLDALGRALHSLQDSIAHSGIYSIPRIHYFTGGHADSEAMEDIKRVDRVGSETASVLRRFKASCMKCQCL